MAKIKGTNIQEKIEAFIKKAKIRSFVTKEEILRTFQIKKEERIGTEEDFKKTLLLYEKLIIPLLKLKIKIKDNRLPKLVEGKKLQKKVPKKPFEEIQKYLKEIGELPVLNAEEEKELFKRIEKGDEEARKQVGRAYLKLVVKIAEYYVPRTKKLSLLDLIQEGNLGLFRAVEIYDWRSNYRFSTFATLLIRNAILRAIEDKKRILKKRG
ncbi:MAG: hypothetical protein COS76_00565 [Candidatus Portnoybacteria bacterium CG06_land_8_20_14_3_00_39_12]|uniref:RNA polymerase sigma-70 domain-containing protein n=1 Tax=Candidatus Portnoybacteria bacterium CG06_land_8_20_14_3_00_39_12 TaxID=1974809 RepID=A0A2M7AY54_9BACT|nr:MAG: hypothetical protein COS76_00565 [Candidatus Portnoybacteria bacterium CG06_land_8_20_14_3_00_39_12]